MTNERDDYLWDRSGERDRDVVRLEGLLARYRYDAARDPGLGGKPRLRQPILRRPSVRAVLLAAGVLLGLGLWRAFGPRGERPGYEVSGGADVSRVEVGEHLETGAASALLRVAGIGQVRIDPSSRLRVDGIAADEHRLFLERGSVHATIFARPREFQIGTPAGLSIDLGCEYELSVDDAGRSTMTVTSGRVEFAGGGRRVVVPAGATCQATRESGPNVPVRVGADPRFVAAVRALEHATELDSGDVTTLVEADVSANSVTLWHLFLNATSPDLRAQMYDRLATRYPPPQNVDAGALRRGEPGQLAAWRASIEGEWSWYGD